jgi:PPOX class probable F420-dependent enzyme
LPVSLSPGIRKLIEGKNFAHLAILMKDGSPQVTPVWIDLDGDRIVVNTADGRVKARNVRRDPRVAISITEPGGYPAAFVRGRVVEITREGAEDHIDKMAKKYMGQDTYPLRRPDQPRLKLIIEPDHATGMMVD